MIVNCVAIKQRRIMCSIGEHLVEDCVEPSVVGYFEQ